ncbi:MAG: peptide chain release factor N(5)-glutamine methyltransferase [Bacteroidales bacterium]|nr:peptide chain release factor N(5)-glutamine methyltransferase [Lachnoclostridium sp.]MCM1384332.1 peptide chain release factor N(5)-glutamine methyltransferase [Lachnoclostridium sp.]MCM1464913.1 peptide chain release factor N(5)-glutamine methyltransferase [Bacteroidales bacterium]
MTYRELFEQGRSALVQARIGEAELDARLLLEYVCQTDRNTFLIHGDRVVGTKEEEEYRRLLSERVKHVPLQYLTGEQEFMGLPFEVNKDVLIPRQDTEILVEEVLKKLHDGMRILDMCTGSGCILISLLRYSNHCSGVGADISEDALKVARRNGERIFGQTDGASKKQITWVQSDLFSHVTGKFEFIVSNPPYIKSGEIPDLMPEVRDYEPRKALDGGGDGLYFYRKMIEQSGNYLMGGGMLYFEIGYAQAEEVSRLMEQAGFMEVTIVQDYAGLDRVVYGTWLG